MKVIFFDFTTMVGGATKGTIYLLNRLRKKGMDIGVIDVYGSCKEHFYNLKEFQIPCTVLLPRENNLVIGYSDRKFRRIIEIFKQIPTFFLIFFCLINVLRLSKPEYILVNNEKSLVFLIFLKKIINFKIILYYRNEANINQMNKRFVFLLNNYVDILYCHSKIAISNMQNYGVNKDIIYLPNCVNVSEVCSFMINNKSKKTKTFSILLNSGRIVEEKGYHTAIEALFILKNKGYSLTMIFPGLKVDDNYYNNINQMIDSYNLTNNITFLGWVDDIYQVLNRVDCMILPSYSEGFPRSIIEAMLLRIPVCATPVGGVPEAIIDGETGYIFEVNNAIQLAEKIEKLLIDNIARNDIVENAFNFAKINFDEDLNTSIFINCLS